MKVTTPIAILVMMILTIGGFMPSAMAGWESPKNVTQYINSTTYQLNLNNTNETNVWFNSTKMGNTIQYLQTTLTDLGAYGILPTIAGISDSPILPFFGFSAMTSFKDSQAIIGEGINPVVAFIRTDGGAVTHLGSITLIEDNMTLSATNTKITGNLLVDGAFAQSQLVLDGFQIMGHETAQTGMAENDTLVSENLKMGNGALLCFDNGNLNCMRGTDTTNISIYTNQVETMQINALGTTTFGTAKADYFVGDGSGITNLTAWAVNWANVTNKPPYANVSQINTTSYLPLTGGTLTGNLTLNSNSNITIVKGVVYLNGTGKVCFWGNCNNSISSADNRGIEFRVNNTLVFNVTPAGVRALSVVSTGAGSSYPSLTVTGALVSNTNTVSGYTWISLASIINSTVFGLYVSPSQTVTAGNVTRYSPSVLWQGKAWNGTFASTTNWDAYVSPVSLTPVPRSNWILQSWIVPTGLDATFNNTQVLNISDTGNMIISGNYTAGGSSAGTSKTYTMCASGACLTTCTIITTGGLVTGGTC